MAHAMCGDFESLCLKRLMGNHTSSASFAMKILGDSFLRLLNSIRSKRGCAKAPLTTSSNSRFSHFKRWGIDFYNDVRGRVVYTSGCVLHLWHGDPANRGYLQRNDELTKCNFNPFVDLEIGINGTWKWSSNNFQLHKWAKEYFAHRKEDGEKDALGQA